jgi:serine/threonine protein kinase
MPATNQRVGEFVLMDRINRGTFGEVWKAHHHVWAEQIVAVKIPTDPQYIRNLQREGIAIHGLEHPNIVQAIGFDPYAQTPYLAMEYVPGSSLRPLIQKRSISPSDAVSIMRQVLAGLSHAHSRGIIHRDIKPENILVHERAFKEGFASPGAIKVTDFGLGRAATDTAAGSIAYSASMASPEARDIAGTLDYMPPEIRSGAQADARADLYACGVVLYEMLTGEKPAGTELPSDLNKAVPKVLDEAFRRSYSRLEKRFTSADEFTNALRSGPAIPPIPHGIPTHAHPSPLPPLKNISPGHRPSGLGRHQCPQCRQGVDPTDQFCMNCGLQLVENIRRCPQCGGYPDAADQYCMFCGQGLSVASSTVA